MTETVNTYKNPEGYADPTPYEALKSVDAPLKTYKPLVYICSPYRGDVEANVERARRYSRYAYEQDVLPFAPHLLFPQFLDDEDPDERDAGLFFGKVVLYKCKELWVFLTGGITEGMAAEIKTATRKDIEVKFFIDALDGIHPLTGMRFDFGGGDAKCAPVGFVDAR